VDGAFTEKEENNPSAMTVWGVFQHRVDGDGNALANNVDMTTSRTRRRIILLHAWRKHLKFSGPRVDRRPNETPALYKHRTQGDWGLVEWVADTCRRFKVHLLLIEGKASGISAAQELQNRYGQEEWSIQIEPVKGDKVARALAAQPTFSQGLVYAPDRDWAQ